MTEALPWPADKVERRDVASLVPAARNARTHSPEQVQEIANSIREWGWTIPVLIDEVGGIIAGHGRVLAASELGLATVPVMVARGWTEAQKRAYALADNKLALNAGWDLDLLRIELADLRGMAVDLGTIGFHALEIDQLFAHDRDPAEEWAGMPDFTQDDQHAFRSIVVHFKDQGAVDEFARLLGQSVSAKAKYMWFPWEEPHPFKDQQPANAAA
jgi:hypothetical protein